MINQMDLAQYKDRLRALVKRSIESSRYTRLKYTAR